jgi:hypothetical protein
VRKKPQSVYALTRKALLTEPWPLPKKPPPTESAYALTRRAILGG